MLSRDQFWPVLSLFLIAAPAFTAEPWADKRLPESARTGLVLWLDAAAQNAARKAAGKPELAHQAPVDEWYDSSGHGRHLTQSQRDSRPSFQLFDGGASVRFDGKDDFLDLPTFRQSFRELSVFIVAAPFSNMGDFRGLFALNADGKNDYSSGMNVCFSWPMTQRWETLNVEGAGAQGAGNLLNQAADFGTLHRVMVTSEQGDEGIRLFFDGQPGGKRKRTEPTVHADRITVGARFYSNEARPPYTRGFLDGDIAEVLVFDRVLKDEERHAIDKYLEEKYRQAKLPPRVSDVPGSKPLVTVADPPPVQVFVPGFRVRQLPLDLPNINNVLYRPDGKLVALAYNGDIYLLSDTDGDGLEDKAELFWENKGRLTAPIGMALTPPNYKHGSGVFVPSKGKCSLIVDTDGDDKADKEIVIAEGWNPLPHGVDALGIAVHPTDGSIYFGLGTTNYANGYLIDKEGKAHYDLKNERGTILRVSPDFKSREIICTGIRFPVGIRFNADGELFCTDQEGATWLPNGNPLDELLHIEKGRHYGFPPRHPRHLPDVIDEPSVFDYAPQHQSTCGLNFNDPVNGGPIFGPKWWKGDALISAYSRGKLYRTKLVKAPEGYIAQNQLFASLTMLTVDACVSPKGDLVVAVHSGGPDWGSGPTGKGKLYQISYAEPKLPQPVLAWAQGPREVRVAFDRPLEPEHVRSLSAGVKIEYGRYASAGDRFEVLRPGYQVVQDQLRTPRFELPVYSVQLSQDRRTLILSTAPHPEAAGYALTLPGLGRPPRADTPKGELSQVPETDLRYDLCGVEAEWRGEDGSTWSGWLPHLDLTASRVFTKGSATHDELWMRCKQPGRLTLRTKLDLWQMLRPAVQPGSKLDHEWPEELVTLSFPPKIGVFRGRPGDFQGIISNGKPLFDEAPRERKLDFHPKVQGPVELMVNLGTGVGLDTTVTYHTNEDPRERALPLHRFLLPWAALKKEPIVERNVHDIPELKGGNWERGRRVFFSEQAACAKCHRVGGEGSVIGPDLSNLPHRDYASVLRDITEPSFAINPDYISHTVTLNDGRQLTGVLRTERDLLHVGDKDGKVTTFRREQIESLRPSPVSVMPEGLPKQLGPDKMRDLLTFLLTEPPRMPDYGPSQPPPARTMNEVQAVLAGAPEPPAKTRPIHIVLVTGRKDHGLGEHDYPAWQRTWSRLLAMADDVKVTTANDWPAAEDFKRADVVVFYQQGKWTPERAKDVDAFLARGGGLVYIHYAVDGGADAPGFAQRIGLAWQGGRSKFRHGPLDLGFETGSRHPIGRNFSKVHFHDESYWNLVGDPKQITLLASGKEEGAEQPLFWTLEPSKGRVFVSIPGHFAWTFDDPLFRVLLLRGILWTAREPVDRFNALVTPGARIAEREGQVSGR
jgi:putative heme-binding domain-containing protein